MTKPRSDKISVNLTLTFDLESYICISG